MSAQLPHLVTAGGEAAPFAAQVEQRLAAVQSALRRRRHVEQGLLLIAALLIGLAAVAWGLAPAACALLVAAAAAGIFALVPSGASVPSAAAAWLDADAVTRGGTALVWRSACVATPPFRTRLLRQAITEDGGALPGIVRMRVPLLVAGVLLLASLSTVASPRGRGGSSPSAGVPLTAGGRPAPPAGVAVLAGNPTAAPPEPVAPTAGAPIPPGARAVHPDPAPQGGGASISPQQIDPALLRPDLASARGANSPEAPADPTRERVGIPTPELGQAGASAAPLRTPGGSDVPEAAAGQGEGVGQSPSSRDGRSAELPETQGAPRAERLLTAPPVGSAVDARALRERVDAPNAAPGDLRTPQLHVTSLATGRWALTAAERSYLIRWDSARRARSRPPHVAEAPSNSRGGQ